MATINVSDSDFSEKVLNSSLPVLVDFWAPWCGPCRMAEPVLEELSEAYAEKIIIAKVNVDENQSPANYGVMSIPTAILFKQGKEVGRTVGFSGKQGFEDLIKANI